MKLEKYTEEQKMEMESLYRNGKSIRQVAKIMATSSNSVNAILKERGLIKGKWRFTEVEQEKQENIIRLYKEGMNIKEIASELHVGKNYANKICRNAGLITNQNRIFTEEFEGRILEAYTKGFSSITIGNFVDVTPTAVRDAVKRLGGKTRSVGHKSDANFDLKLLENILGNFQEHIRKYNLSVTRKCLRMEDHPQWSGGKKIDDKGYVLIRIPKTDPYYCMTRQTGEVYEHRYVMAQFLNRPLEPRETVHHKNGIKTDNDPTNLQLHHDGHLRGFACRCRVCGSVDIEFVEI